MVDVTCECHSNPAFVCRAPCAQAYRAEDRDSNGEICVFHWERYLAQCKGTIPAPQMPGHAGELIDSHQIASAPESGNLSTSSTTQLSYGAGSARSGPSTPGQPTSSFYSGLRGALVGDTPPSWSSSSHSNPESQPSRSPEEVRAAGVLAELAFSNPAIAELAHRVRSTSQRLRTPDANTIGTTETPVPVPTIRLPRSPNSPPTPLMPTRSDFAVAQLALALWNSALNPEEQLPDIGLAFYGDDVCFTAPSGVTIRPWTEVYQIVKELWARRHTIPTPAILTEDVPPPRSATSLIPPLPVENGLPSDTYGSRNLPAAGSAFSAPVATSEQSHNENAGAKRPHVGKKFWTYSTEETRERHEAWEASQRETPTADSTSSPADSRPLIGGVPLQHSRDPFTYSLPEERCSRARSRSPLRTDAPIPEEAGAAHDSCISAPPITRIPTDCEINAGTCGHSYVRPPPRQVRGTCGHSTVKLAPPPRVVTVRSPINWIFELTSPRRTSTEGTIKTPAAPPTAMPIVYIYFVTDLRPPIGHSLFSGLACGLDGGSSRLFLSIFVTYI